MAEEQPTTDGSSTVATKEELRARSRDVLWYVKELRNIPEAAREVFEGYSKIPPENVHDHVYQAREKAWDVWPFPCLGGWRFLNLNLCTTPEYSEILSRLRDGDKLLDLGCCFGQELRRAILDGAPGANLYGSDLRPEFFDIGYDLFLDRDRCDATFIAADIFDESEELYRPLKGKISIVYAGAFFHLFDRPQQLQVAKIITRILKPEAGSMILGRQVGSVKPGLYEHGTNPTSRMYRHDAQSWKELWEEAGNDMGVEWKVESELRDSYRGDNRMADDSVRELRFCVRRR